MKLLSACAVALLAGIAASGLPALAQGGAGKWPDTPTGFASQNALGRNGTTGGRGGRTVTVTDQADLERYAAIGAPCTIRVRGTIAVKPFGKKIDVASHKTILGIGADATIRHGGFRLNRVHNVVIRNLTIRDSYVEGDWEGKTNDFDAIQVDDSHHVWIDHCHLTRMGDGLLDLRKTSDYITVSWNILSNHNKTFGLGWTRDTDRLHVTIHHNWFRNTFQRNPSFDNGAGHLFNNYLENIRGYGNWARGSTKMVVENSVFRGVANPLQCDAGAELAARGNVFQNVSGRRETRGSAFDPRRLYAYTLDPAARVPEILRAGAGPQAGVGEENMSIPAAAAGAETDPAAVRPAGLYADVEYGRAGGETLLLDAFVPEGAGPFPVAILVHGGGWASGDKAKDILDPIAEPLSKAGFAWFSINYRLAPKNRWPAAFEDVQTALRWVKAHAAEFRGDPERIALIGYSAGGHLACLAAVRAEKNTRVQAVVGFAAPTDLPADTERRGGLSKSLQDLLDRPQLVDAAAAEILQNLSPITYVRPGLAPPGLPPFLLIHGTEDRSVPYAQSVNFAKRLREIGVPSDLITVPGAPHAIAQWDKFDSIYRTGMAAWLLRTLGPVRPDITVAADGSGNYRTIQAALDAIPKNNRERIVVLIKEGVYREKIRIDAAGVTLRGQSRENTRIEYAQLNEDFQRNPDPIGRAVVNVDADDLVLENLTVANTAGIVGPHSFAIYGKGDRTVIVDCDVLSEGADTVSLWRGESGRYYHARCRFRGAVDFVCPRGWCYVTDSTFLETKATAAVWHDGSKDRDMKFVLRRCRFDGVEGWNLARHHHDAQFFFLDCVFSKTMIDRAPFRVRYPLDGSAPTAADSARNAELDKTNRWGERAYFHNCHREGGDYPWHRDNLASAPGAPAPDQITAAWTFAGKWDPERRIGPTLQSVRQAGGRIEVRFSESVTAKGKPRLALRSGGFADYAGGSGTDTLIFAAPAGQTGAVTKIDLGSGAIIASEAGATLRVADVTLPDVRGT